MRRYKSSQPSFVQNQRTKVLIIYAKFDHFLALVTGLQVQRWFVKERYRKVNDCKYISFEYNDEGTK